MTSLALKNTYLHDMPFTSIRGRMRPPIVLTLMGGSSDDTLYE
jgi:hypothetical protein